MVSLFTEASKARSEKRPRYVSAFLDDRYPVLGASCAQISNNRSNLFRRLSQWIIEQVRVSSRCVRLGMAEKGPDHWERMACTREDRRIGVT